MKWFKHDVGASDDVRIMRLEAMFGNDGYAVYFKCLEIVGKEGTIGKISFDKCPKIIIAKKCSISEVKLEKILEYMGKIHLCCYKSLKRKVLYFPKFRKRADDYTKRVLRNSVQCSDKVPLEEKRTEVDKMRIDYRDSVSAFYVEKKGYDKSNMTNGDWTRIQRACKELNFKSKGNIKDSCSAISWVSRQTYIDWTLETVNKKYQDYAKTKLTPEVEKAVSEIMK